MPTRTQIRDAEIALLLAHPTISALVGTRVYDETHAPYPAASPHPALIVYSPGGDSSPLAGDLRHWTTTEQLVVECILSRTATQTDGDLSTAADALERAVRRVTLKSDGLMRSLSGIERLSSAKVDKARGNESDAHRIVVLVTFGVEIIDTFIGEGLSDEDLEIIRINEHLVNETTGVPAATPDVVVDVAT
jgi:hypothetical protein